MKKLLGNRNVPVSPKQLYEFYSANAEIEKLKLDKQKKILEEKIKAASKGHTIVLNNNTK